VRVGGYVHTGKQRSQNTTTRETRSHVQYDTTCKDHVRWQDRQRAEPAGAAERGRTAGDRRCGGRAATLRSTGCRGRAGSGQGRLGAARRDPTAAERFGARPPAAEHQSLVASRNASPASGCVDSTCLASRHLPRDSGLEAGSAAPRQPRALRSSSRARPQAAHQPPSCAGKRGSNGTGALVLGSWWVSTVQIPRGLQGRQSPSSSISCPWCEERRQDGRSVAHP